MKAAITLWAAAAALFCAGASWPGGAQAQSPSPQPPGNEQPRGTSGGIPTIDVPTTPGTAPSTTHPGQAGPGATPSPGMTPPAGAGMPRPGTQPGHPPPSERRGPGEGRGSSGG